MSVRFAGGQAGGSGTRVPHLTTHTVKGVDTPCVKPLDNLCCQVLDKPRVQSRDTVAGAGLGDTACRAAVRNEEIDPGGVAE